MDLTNLTPGQIEFLANKAEMSPEEYISAYSNNEPGKTNDSMETDPPASQNTETSAGESSSGDISLGSPELKPVDKALKSLADINVSEEFKLLEENIDVVKRTAKMRETAKGTMSATGEFYETRVYDSYLDPAKKQLGEGAAPTNIEEKAKSLYLTAQKRALVDRKAEEILEDFDDEIYTPLGRLRKYASRAFSGIDFSEGGEKRRELEQSVKESKNAAYTRIDELSLNRAAQETYLVSAGDKLQSLQNKYENSSESITQEDVTEYNNVSASFTNVLNTYKETEDELSEVIETGENLEQLVDLTKRSYDNLDIAGGRVTSTVLNIASGLTQVVDEAVRLSNPIYTPLYASLIEDTPLSKVSTTLKDEAEKITGKIEKRQELGKIKSPEDFLEFTLDLFSEQAVNTAVTASMPGVGLYLVAAGGAGQKFIDMREELGAGANYTPLQFYGTGFLYGAGEYVTEKVSLNQFLGAKNAVKKAFNLSGTSLTNKPMTTLKAIDNWGVNLNKEGAAELGSQFISNFADKVVLGKSISMWEGLGEAYFSGAVMSGLGFGAPGLVANIYSAATTGNEQAAASRNSKKIAELTNRINQMTQGDGLKNPDVGDAVVLLQEEADGLLKENLKSMKAAGARIDELSKPDKSMLLNIDSQIWKTKGAVDRINSNESLTEAEKKNLIIKHDKTVSKLESRKDDVLANSEASKSRAKAKMFQMEAVANSDLDYKVIQTETIEEALLQARDLVEKSNLSDEQKAELNKELDVAKNKGNVNGFFAGTDQGLPFIVTTDEGARENRSVEAHEASHATLFKKLFQGDANIIGVTQDLMDYMVKNYGQVAVDKFNTIKANYEDETPAGLAEEYLVGTMELARKFDLKSNANKTLQGKLLSRWNKMFPGNKAITSIKSGKDVLAAIEAFNASFDTGTLNPVTKKILQGKLKIDSKSEGAFKVAIKNVRFSKGKDISKQADRAKQVLEKVSSNMDFFDPNSPLIARVLPGMIQAQLAKLSIKGLQFDMDEANSDIVYRLYSNGDINKFDGRGTLYGYINGRISFRIKDMLKASGEGKNDIVEDFNQSDIEDLKGEAADVTTIEQIEERTEAEKPEYRPLLNSRIAEPELIQEILGKIPRIVGTLKSRIDAPVSKNTTVTPLVNELRLALGKQVDIDLKIAMGGKKDGVLRRFLTDNKKAILENMTTTYLMSAFPAAIQKQVDGVFTSDWKDKKIDRESVDTDKAGRTSGAELVRRLPNASTKIDDKTFLSFILDEKGNPLRGKKESLAKAIGEELAIEIINQEMQNPDSQIRQAFEANQERIGTEIADNYIAKLKLDFERGNIKYSKGFTQAELRSAKNTAALDIVLNKVLRSDKVFPDDYTLDNENFNTGIIQQFKLEAKELGVDLNDVNFEKVFWHIGEIINSTAADYKLEIDARFSNLIPQASKEVQEELEGFMTVRRLKSKGELKTLKKYLESVGIVQSRISINELKAFGIGAFKGTVKPKAIVAANKINAEILSNVTKYTTKEVSAKALFELQKNGDINNTLQSSGMIEQIQAQNLANKILSSRIAGEFILAVQKGEMTLMDFARFLQRDNSTRNDGFGPLGQLTIIDGNIDYNSGQYIEHMFPNVQFMFELLEIAGNPKLALVNNELGKETIDAIDKAYEKNILMSTDQLTANPVIDKILSPTNPANIERLRLYGEAARANTYFAAINEEGNLITLTDYFESLKETEAYTEKIDINFKAVQSFEKWLQPSVKFSISKPTAVFMVGGPGSGKSSTLEGLGLIDKGYRLVNQDPYLEKYIKDAGLASDEKTYNKEERSLRAKLGWKARKAAEEDLANNTAGRESMVIDGTGASYKATTKKMKALEDAGFEIQMIFVNTSKDIAVERNRARAERSLADFIVTKTWDSVQESAKQYKEDYAGRFYEINTDNLSYGEALPEAFVNKVNTGLEASGIKFSKGLSEGLNEIIERNKGVAADKLYSVAQARMQGEKKGKYRLFVPASAEDFRGLTSYTFAGKGKQGEADQKFIEDNLITPYIRGIAMIEAIKQQVRREYNALAKTNKQYFKMLGKKIDNSDYTYDQALRVYMWTQQGIEIPGMDKADIRFLINAINAIPQLIELGNAMQLISRQDTWAEPGEHWLSRTLVSDLNGMTEKVGRKKYLQEFIENSEVIFSPENLNKIEAVYGTNHRSAIEDSLYSMTNGTNRTAGSKSRQVNAWLNWVNNSTGAIMFLNVRSAILQTLSATNFINWSDNNPLKAAAAFANQPQYWSDFAMIFNSDKLKQRRSGLQTDVNQAEIANQAEGAKNKAGAVIAYLLKIGFTPTQIADSFAIAMGGAPMYRNRVNTYVKDGMSKENAEKQAFEDFSKTADEAQQSSDPYLVSQEQRSVLGRLVLAFQNTPMQYTRLMKKSMQDLANRRGDPKTHISKIIYYGAVQNFIFSALQSALFAVIPGFDDEEESEMTAKELEKLERKNDKRILRIINSMTDSILKGSGVRGAVLATIKNTITEYFIQKDKGFMADRGAVVLQVLSISPPIGSKLRKINSALAGEAFNRDILKARGFEIMQDGRVNLSPAYSILGSLVSGTTNLPMDRVVDLINGYSEALDSRNTEWQRIALALGWKTWDVGAKNEEHDLIKIEAKTQRKKEGKAKSASTRSANKKTKYITPAEYSKMEAERKARNQ